MLAQTSRPIAELLVFMAYDFFILSPNSLYGGAFEGRSMFQKAVLAQELIQRGLIKEGGLIESLWECTVVFEKYSTIPPR